MKLVYIYNRSQKRTWIATIAEAYYCYKSHQLWPIHGDYTVVDFEGNQLAGVDLVTLMYKERKARKVNDV